MTFLAPLWLLAASAAAIPLILHLIFQRRFITIEWAAAQFLFNALEKNKRKLVLENIILLLLRVLFLMLIALIFAVPMMKKGFILNLGDKVAATIIVLDNSYSMGQRYRDTTLFEIAKKNCIEIVNKLNKSSEIVFFPLLISDPHPGKGTFDRAFVIKAIKKTSLSYEPVRLEAVMERISSITKESKTAGHNIYFITDLQKVTWDLDPDSMAGKYLLEITEKNNVTIAYVSPSGISGNLGITSLMFKGRPATRGRKGTVEALVKNYTGAEQEVTMEFFLNGKRVGTKTVTVEPEETQGINMDILFTQGGVNNIEVRIGEDSLEGDNARFYVVEIKESIDILAVNGESSIEALKDETDYFRKAMNPAGDFTVSEDIVINVTEVDERGFNQKNIFNYDIILLANVMRISEEKVRALHSYIDRGGAVIISAGEMLNKDYYNSVLYNEGKGLMPCRIGSTINKKETYEAYTLFDLESVQGRMLAFLKKFRSGIAENIHFTSYFDISMNERDQAEIALRFQDGLPAVVIRSGRGTVCFLNFTIDDQWTDFPAHPLYLPFFREMVNYLINEKSEYFVSACGDPVTIEIPSPYTDSKFTVITPETSVKDVEPSLLDRGYVIECSRTRVPGFYRISTDGFTVVQARNPWVEEGVLVHSIPEDIQREFPDTEIHFVAIGKGGRFSPFESGETIWRVLAVFALVVLVLEGIIAFRSSR